MTILEYKRGEMGVIISVPHNGEMQPDLLEPERTSGFKLADLYRLFRIPFLNSEHLLAYGA